MSVDASTVQRAYELAVSAERSIRRDFSTGQLSELSSFLSRHPRIVDHVVRELAVKNAAALARPPENFEAELVRALEARLFNNLLRDLFVELKGLTRG